MADCTAGQRVHPVGCERHQAHHWCNWCEGWFGVPHDNRCHTAEVRQDKNIPGVGRPMPGQCACRYCKTLAKSGHAKAELMRGVKP